MVGSAGTSIHGVLFSLMSGLAACRGRLDGAKWGLVAPINLAYLPNPLINHVSLYYFLVLMGWLGQWTQDGDRIGRPNRVSF